MARHNGDGPGSQWSCVKEGCINTESEESEFMEEDKCKKHCKSWVKRDGKVIQVSGFPWDSYATKKAAEIGHYDQFLR